MLHLRYETPEQWARVALSDLDAFLQDHAANERKACWGALQLASQHPERSELCDAMVAMAEEEMQHFRQVYDLLSERGATLGFDAPDPYMRPMHRAMRKQDANDFLLDRLLLFAIIEARGCERFGLIAEALEPGPMKDFYADLTACEARHHAVYVKLARHYFDEQVVQTRFAELLELEAKTVRALPLRSALH